MRLVHAAGDHETQWALQLLAPVASRLGRVETVFADQAYQGLEEKLDRELGWELQVVESDGEGSGFSIDPKRWIVERTYGGSADGVGWTESTSGGPTPARHWCTSLGFALP
jgi:putative transposase